MSIVIVTGVPGVGKSTVMNAAKDFGYNIVNFGTTELDMAFTILAPSLIIPPCS